MSDHVLEFEKSLVRRTGRVPFPYQRVDARWLTKRRRGLLFHDPGLGKSWIWLLALPPRAAALLACPGVAKGKWADEVRTVRPDLRPVIVEGRREFRWPQPGEVVIVNWEILPHSYREFRRAHLRQLAARRQNKRAEALRELRQINRSRARLTIPYPGTVVIGDELHRAKSETAKLTLRWRELSALALAHHGRSWGGTGTPLVNKLRELYTVLQAAGLGERAFGTMDEFLRLSRDNPGEFRRRLRLCSIRRSRADVLAHLPRITREVLPVRIGEAARQEADRLVAAMRSRGLRLDRLTLENLRQLAAPGSPLKGAVSTVRAALAQAKMPAVLELVHELTATGVDAIVAGSMHKAPALELELLPGWTKITGDEQHEEKFKRAAAFQRGEFCGVALTYAAAGEAIDLFRSWRAIEIDLPWTVARIDQFESRIQRIGQKAAGLLVTRVVADHPLERRCEEILRAKQEEIEAHVEASARKARQAAS